MDTLKSAGGDWHKADIKAALQKRGITLTHLAKKHGYAHIQKVLTGPWWAAEQIVAQALGMRPETIWPSRYTLPRDRSIGMTRRLSVGKAGAIQRKKGSK